MIFKPALVRKILRGEKTQTRRPVKPSDADEFGINRCRYQTGKSYSVQPGRGRPGEFRVIVTTLRRQLAGDITLEDAIAEGFRTTEEFKAYWLGLYEPKFSLPDEGCIACHAPALSRTGFCVSCGVEDQAAARTTLILDCFEDRHAATPVWAITFAIDSTERPRLLASTSRDLGPKVKEGDNPALAELDQYRGYTSSVVSALQHEPEAVDRATQDDITSRAGMVTSQWRAVEQAHRDRDLQLLSIEERMVRARRAAALSRIDVSNEMYLLRTRLLRGSGPEAVVKRLHALENRVYRTAA